MCKKTTYIEDEIEMTHEPIEDSVLSKKYEDGSWVVGYLSYDTDYTHDGDGMGEIVMLGGRHRSNDETFEEACRAIGVSRDGSPDLDLVDDADIYNELMRRIMSDEKLFARTLAACIDQYEYDGKDGDKAFVMACLEYLEECDGLTDLVYVWQKHEDEYGSRSKVAVTDWFLSPIIESIRQELYEKGLEDGTIGDPCAVVLDHYEHGGIMFWVSGDRGHYDQWDTSRGSDVWLPDDCVREHIIEKAKSENRPVREVAVEVARGCVEYFNQIYAGDVYGVVTETSEGGYDACWGYVGNKYAEEELKSSFESAVQEFEHGKED